MGKDLRPLIEWSAVQSCFDDPIFDRAATAELLLAVGPPSRPDGMPIERVQAELREITASFAFDRWHELQPSASVAEGEASKLAQACRLVLSVAGMEGEPTRDALLPLFGPGGLFAAAALRGEASGEAATMNAFRAVWLLGQDADKMAEVARKRKAMQAPFKGRGRGEERAIKRLVSHLSSLYWLTWVCRPGVTRNVQGEAGGPFVRLLALVNEALKLRGVDHLRTPDALAKVWERLPDDEKLKFG